MSSGREANSTGARASSVPSCALSGPPHFRPSEPPAAVTQNRYRVIGELGRGGMGSVELTEDTLTGGQVALKRLLLKGASGARSQRLLRLFEQEYHVLSQLDHPRIIQVYDYGRDVIGPYYTMEVLQGRDLRQLSPLPYKQVCAIARDVVSSLAIVHGRGFVHRDVTPTNIRCTADGQAKLLDFGAMCPMGVARGLVGTPPFVAPEAIQKSALDGRTDLFSLGASLYNALTGRHAYPASTLGQLPNRWRSVPRAPSAFNPEVPRRLDELVMELLSLSPLARPQSAAVVFERLVAIGDLPRVEELEVRSAYLASPPLVGRDAILSNCREHLLSALRGRGTAALLAGPTGGGGSRLLDMLVLEAKILGAVVLRADASDAVEDYGVLRSLLRQLVEARPGTAPRTPALERLSAGELVAFAERQQTLEAFNAWILEYATDHRLVVAVDDVHLLDEASLAGIAGLASELGGKRILLATAMAEDVDTRFEAATELLITSSKRHAVPALSASDVRRMLASIFGEVAHLNVLSSVLYRHAEGNPGQTMTAAQTLVDTQVVRYSAGAWRLPNTTATLEAAMPASPDLAARVSGLTPEARELAALIAADVHRLLDVDDWVGASTHGDLGRVYRALDELVSVGLVARREGRSDFRCGDAVAQVLAAIPETQRRELHGKLAAMCARAGASSAQAHHALHAGDSDTAERLALAADTRDLSETWPHDPTGVATYEGVIAARCAADPESPTLLRLRCQLFTLCLMTEEWVRVRRDGPRLLEALTQRCGLQDYHALSDTPAEERLSAAIQAADSRQAEALAGRGLAESSGMSLLAALTQLPTVLLGTASSAVLAADPDLVHTLPSLQPLHALSPAFPLVDRMREAISSLAVGEVARSLRQVRGVHAELQGEAPGLEDATRTSLQHFVHGFLQGIEVTIAGAEVIERIEQSKEHSPKRAARERYSYYVAIGDTEMAKRARRDLERMEVQSGAVKYFPHCWEVEYSLHSLTRNVEGLKRCEAEARLVAPDLPGWKTRVELSRLALAQCGATHEDAVVRARALFEAQRRGTADRRYALYLLVYGLQDLERWEEARELLRDEIASLGRPAEWHDGYNMMLALIEGTLGEHEAAAAHVAEHMESYEGIGVRGLLAGHVHEVAAKLAVMAGDDARFHHHAEQCAAHYRSGHNPDLTTRYEMLMRDALERDLRVTGELAGAADFTPRTSASELASMLRTQVSTVMDAPTRHQQLLTLVVERNQARGGLLYLPGDDGGLRRAARTGQAPTEAKVEPEVHRLWSVESSDEALETMTLDDTWEATLTAMLDSPETDLDDGTHVHLLVPGSHAGARPNGVIVLATADGAAPAPDREAIAALAQLILEHEADPEAQPGT